jgi:16S rRNA (guanine966-N2)-methyltransferase
VKSAPGVRITAGALKGRRLEVPPGARPSEGRVREALFSILGAEIENARFLDLFAGSGAVGIEAISRGALTATFVESDRRAVAALSRNLDRLPRGSHERIAGDVDRALDDLAVRGREFDLVFADPPYSRPPEAGLLDAIGRVLAPGGRLAFEHAARTAAPIETRRLVRIDGRTYGAATLTFYGRPGA